MNVLMVLAEDRGVREALRAALPESDVILFETTLEGASRRLVSLQADAILIDDGPGLGAAALPALRALAPGVPVLALSNRGDLVAQAALVRAGSKEVLVKPFSCEALRDAIGAVLARPAPAAPSSAGAAPESEASPALGQHQMALRWLGRAARYGDDPVRLGLGLVETLTDIFDAARCAVLLEQDRHVRVVASLGIPETLREDLRLSFAAGLMRCFDEQASLMDRAQAAASPEALKELQLLGAQLAAPLVREGRVFGALTIGEKASGQPYTQAERDLVVLMARSTSLAFERAQQAHRTETRREQLDRVIGALDAGVVWVARDRTVSLINPAAEALLGVAAADLLGRSVQKLGSAFADVALRVLASGQAVRQAVIHDAAVSAKLVLNAAPMDGEGAVVVFGLHAGDPARAADVAYSPFWEYLASRVAQEIKNPMVAVNTFAQLLPRKYDSEDFRDAYSRVVQQEIARINAVVETLFEFARDPKLTLKRVPLNDALQSAIAAFDQELAARSIALAATWDPKVAEAEVDPVYLTQAVHNVVQNAIEAMPEGGVLRVETRRDGGHAVLRIADTGPGVEDAIAPQVFLPFFSTKEKGMGLGLPIAQRIVQQHRGQIKLVPQDVRGGCFEILLPVTESSHADDSGR